MCVLICTKLSGGPGMAMLRLRLLVFRANPEPLEPNTLTVTSEQQRIYILVSYIAQSGIMTGVQCIHQLK